MALTCNVPGRAATIAATATAQPTASTPPSSQTPRVRVPQRSDARALASTSGWMSAAGLEARNAAATLGG